MWLLYGSLVEVVLILLFLSPFPLNQKKLVHAEDPFNDEHKERQEVEMLAKKFEMKYVSIVFTLVILPYWPDFFVQLVGRAYK